MQPIRFHWYRAVNLATGAIIIAMAFGMSSGVVAGNVVDCPATADGEAQPEPGSIDRGGLVLYPDLAAFQDTVGFGLTHETFDGGTVTEPGDGIGGCVEPVNSSSDDSCYSPGDLAEGFSLTSTSGGGYVVLGDNHAQVGQEGLAVGPQNIISNEYPNVATFLEFDADDITAVSMGVIPGCNGLNVIVQVFDLEDSMIGSTTISTDASWHTGFLGFTSPNPVGRITLATSPSGGQLIQDLRFGADPDPIFRDRFEPDE